MKTSPNEGAPQPRVSGIITAYNGEAYVAEAIDSVLSQTRPVDELLVIDDGSTDRTAEIVEGYRSRGVRLVKQENRGLARARNRGIAETTGDLIAFLDCDDLWLPEKNGLQVQHLVENPSVGLVTCDVLWWEGGKRWIRPQRIGRTPAATRRELALRNCVGNASGVMLRRSVLSEVGVFDPEQIWAEDWELWMRIVAQFRISIVHRPLMVYRAVSTSLTQQNRWQRAEGYYQLSRAAIRRSRPSFWRPLLILRAWSWREHCRGVCAQLEGLPRWRYLLHATLALLSWPFELTRHKVQQCVHALFGDGIRKFYRLMRSGPPQPVPRS
jgi:glycosyltransferase involved in cell wall biosynthesis